MNAFRRLLAGNEPVVAPLALTPLAALLAEQAGFKALYLGGGAMGYAKAVTEANLTVTEMAAAGLDIRTVCSLPLILDGAAGWGDPMHMHRTIGMAEAAGFAAIEVEDQLLPKRAHHHIGIEHMIPMELMVEKIREGVAARRDPDFVIIGRTNAARSAGIDDALRRGEAYRRAGSDILLVLQKTPEEMRLIGERLGGPLMCMASGSGIAGLPMSMSELHKLGYQLVVDAQTPLQAAFVALRDCYADMYRSVSAGPSPGADPLGGREGRRNTADAIHATINLDHMLEIERRTVER